MIKKPKLKPWMRLKKNHNEPEPYMLLYPEGRILLNTHAYEILRLCDGNHHVDDIINILSEKYANVDNEEVHEFIDMSTNNLWFESTQSEPTYWDQDYLDQEDYLNQDYWNQDYDDYLDRRN